MKQVYPTFIVNTNDGSEHPFLVCVPDMEIFTEGDTFANAIEMARDAIGLAGISMEDNKEQLDHAGINVSRVLQEALMNVLNVKRNI